MTIHLKSLSSFVVSISKSSNHSLLRIAPFLTLTPEPITTFFSLTGDRIRTQVGSNGRASKEKNGENDICDRLVGTHAMWMVTSSDAMTTRLAEK